MTRVLALACVAMLAACSSTSKQKAVVDGQLFCAKATQSGPLVVALATTAGLPVSVIGKTASAVAAACAGIQAIPVSPPPNPTTAPVVAAKASSS